MPPSHAQRGMLCSDVASLSSVLKLDVLDKDPTGGNHVIGSITLKIAELAFTPKVTACQGSLMRGIV
jgi:hypothetical protein